MRSSTIFVAFGIIILGFILFSGLSKRSEEMHPVVRTVNAFFLALQNSDAATLHTIVNEKIATMTFVGSGAHANMTSINFPEYAPEGSGAFTKRPPILWSHHALSELSIDPKVGPSIDENLGIATVTLTGGHFVYLRRPSADTQQWKIEYIEKKDPSKQ